MNFIMLKFSLFQNGNKIVSNEEASDAALLRNFFTVNLSSRNSNRRKGNNPRNFVESKRGTQQKRLGQLFQALSDPIGCKFHTFCIQLKIITL